MGKRIPKAKTNCRDGLTPKQEIEARRLKEKLLDEEQKSEVLEEVTQIWEDYQKITFDDYFKLRNPALHSACKRAGIILVEQKRRPLLLIK